tara:strand:+ start:4720 stop:5418 length:699 start_codon:yes stop_codon:yes gene_type:complete
MSTCSIVQEFKNGDGVTKEFSFSFTYLNPTEVQVSLFDGTSYVTQTVSVDYSFTNATTIKFDVAPIVGVENIRIRRVTNISQLPAYFYPGSTIRAKDLNGDFEAIQQAIEEGQCKSSINNEDIILLAEVVDQNIVDIAQNTADIAALAKPYTLPIASSSVLGGIKVGNNLTIAADGTLNAAGSSGPVGTGRVDTVVGGTNITVDSTDPENPIVSVTTNSFVPSNISSLPSLP